MNIALSIRQPWAWLIVNGYKPIENRNWNTKRRGLFLIHASRKFDNAGYIWVHEKFPDINLPLPDQFDLGGIVGSAHLVGVSRKIESPWFTGIYGFILIKPKPCRFMEINGRLGFFAVNYDPD